MVEVLSDPQSEQVVRVQVSQVDRIDVSVEVRAEEVSEGYAVAKRRDTVE